MNFHAFSKDSLEDDHRKDFFCIINTRVKRKISRFIGYHHLEHANNARMESREERDTAVNFQREHTMRREKLVPSKQTQKMDKAKWYHTEGLGPGSTHLKNSRIREKTMQNSTLCISTQVPTQGCLGRHINLFKTYTEKKITFLPVVKAKILYSVQQPKEKQGNLWLGFLDNLIFPPDTISCL